MSTTREVTVWCDMPGCHDWTTPTPARTVSTARAAARREGWQRLHLGGEWRDICRGHTAAEARELFEGAALDLGEKK